MADARPRVRVIQHQDDAPAGHVGDRLVARGWRLELVRADREPLGDATGADALVVLGSRASAWDDTVPFLADELALLREADAAGVPILGVCFGAQSLARALGGEVRPAEEPEIGWVRVTTEESTLVEPGPWLACHRDVLTPPPGARELARTAAGAQAFVRGPHLGVQFHPEAGPAQIASWAQAYDAELAALGTDPDDLVAETARAQPAARARAERLVDRWLDWIDQQADDPQADDPRADDRQADDEVPA